MKSECHVTVAETILETLHKKYGIELDRENFVYGNTKPDHSFSFLYVRHNLESTFDFVMDDIRSLTGRVMGYSAPFEDYCFELGIICHYITDYFSLAHNDCFNGGFRKHVMYERAQEKLTPVFLGFVKEKALAYQEQNCVTIPELMRMILNRHKQYLNENYRSYVTDFYYAIATCCEVILSIFAIAESKELLRRPLYAVS